VEGAQNLLHACLSLGLNLPYFCWHPAMGSVGACRQCAVKQFKDEAEEQAHGGKIVMACMTPASEGTRIAIEDHDAVQFRAGIIEGLMANHPHDCPVCDEGGECHLQDMTVMTGHNYRRYDFRKRTFRNQDLGPLVNHEMNRCIQCYRCVRFYNEYAGGTDFGAFSLRNLVFFGRSEDGVLESPFSGNLVEVCPTGVFTDKSLKEHYTRKWDLQQAPSICVHCGQGCNVSAGERYGMLRRIINRYHESINGYFLCDRGRYGYEFVNSPDRIRQPQLARHGTLVPVSSDEAVSRAAALAQAGSVIGIGSPRASLEANYALQRLVGPERFFAGLSEADLRLQALALELQGRGPAHILTPAEVEASDAVLVLGEDVMNTAPRLALRIRQSVRQEPLRRSDALKIPRWLDHATREVMQRDFGPVFVATPDVTGLDDVARTSLRAAPDDLARLGFAIAHELDSSQPAVAVLASEHAALAREIAQALARAERPAVVSGSGCRSEAVLRAAAAITNALSAAGKAAGLSVVLPECNSVGLMLLGHAEPLDAALQLVADGRVETAIVLENDLARRLPASGISSFFDRLAHLIVVDSLWTETARRAEVVLPAATFAEGDGTLVNSEGRAQRAFQVYMPQAPIQESWRWLQALEPPGVARWQNLDEAVAAVSAAAPVLAPVVDAAPGSRFRMAGAKVPREPQRYSGRTAMHANVDVREPKPPDDPDTPLTFSMEGNPTQPPAALTPFFWSPGWNSIQAVNFYQREIAGPLRGGEAGVRLLEPSETRGAGGPREGRESIPPAFAPRAGEWLLVPLSRVFGSEELSQRSPSIAQLAEPAHIRLRPADAERLGLQAGDQVQVACDSFTVALPVVVAPDLPVGLAGIVPGELAALHGASLPAWGTVSRAS
jgi:NADH-quinone oxidoreductase subunit G